MPIPPSTVEPLTIGQLADLLDSLKGLESEVAVNPRLRRELADAAAWLAIDMLSGFSARHHHETDHLPHDSLSQELLK